MDYVLCDPGHLLDLNFFHFSSCCMYIHNYSISIILLKLYCNTSIFIASHKFCFEYLKECHAAKDILGNLEIYPY